MTSLIFYNNQMLVVNLQTHDKPLLQSSEYTCSSYTLFMFGLKKKKKIARARTSPCALCARRSKTEDQRPLADFSTGSTGLLTWVPSCHWEVWPTSSKTLALRLATSFLLCALGSLSWSFSWDVWFSSTSPPMEVPLLTCSRSWLLPAVHRNQWSQTCSGKSDISYSN